MSVEETLREISSGLSDVKSGQASMQTDIGWIKQRLASDAAEHRDLTTALAGKADKAVVDQIASKVDGLRLFNAKLIGVGLAVGFCGGGGGAAAYSILAKVIGG